MMPESIESTIARQILAGKVVPFLGAGANLADRLPGDQFTVGQTLPSGEELATYLMSSIGGSDPSVPLARAAQHVDLRLGNGPLYDALHELFDRDYPPTSVHTLLARVATLLREHDKPRQLIVTTNYDDCLEQAFVQAGEPFDLLIYISVGDDQGYFRHIKPSGESAVVASPNKYTKISVSDRSVILKLHGAVVREDQTSGRDSYVITEDDYIGYPLFSDLARFVPITLAKVLMDSHMLFLGYSLEDWNLRVILHRIWGSRALAYNSWAIQLGFTDLDKKSWKRRGSVELIESDLVTFVDSVDSALDSLTDRSLSADEPSG